MTPDPAHGSAASLAGDPFDVATLITLADADALRQHLDDLNESGTDPIAVGWSAPPYPRPFLITLVGCYADSEDVLFDSPWQRDVDYGERIDGKWVPRPPRCEECQAQAHGIENLSYPVVVVVRSALFEAGEQRG